MTKAMLQAIVLALAFTGYAHAADTTAGEGATTMKVEDAAGTKNKVDGDIDQEITNAKLRAESGSKSKYSLSLNGGYTGGTLSQAFGTKRPRLSGEPGSQDFTSLDMGLDGRYRWSKNDSVTLGTQFGFVTPFQGRVTGNDAVNVNDPVLGYSHVGKIAGLQTVASLSYAYGTSISSKDIDLTHQIFPSFNMMKAYQNGLSIGVNLGATYNLFDSKPGTASTKLADAGAYRPGFYGNDGRTEWNLGIYPQAEYEFNDKLSARTVFGYFNWKHLYGDNNRSRMLQTYVYQSIGVGYALTRDVFLYPNIQFVPDNIRSDFTNFAMSASINIF